MPGDELKRLDGNPIVDKTGEVRAFLVVRNESLRLPYVLEYHRKLGIDRFFIVDNGSDDGTTELLLKQRDVHLFSTAASYAASNCGVNWINQLLDAYGTGYWTLTIDADELFVYPRCEEADIHRYSRYLESQNAAGVFCLLLDMYSSNAIKDTNYQRGAPLIDSCPYFDAGEYRLGKIPSFPYVRISGGVRQRVFWHPESNRGFVPPWLSKVPFVKWSCDLKFLSSTHTITPLQLAEYSCTLLHFKFLFDFHERALVEAQRGEHYMVAREYKAYLDVCQTSASLSLFHSGSVRYRDSKQLAEIGISRILQQSGGLS